MARPAVDARLESVGRSGMTFTPPFDEKLPRFLSGNDIGMCVELNRVIRRDIAEAIRGELVGVRQRVDPANESIIRTRLAIRAVGHTLRVDVDPDAVVSLSKMLRQD